MSLVFPINFLFWLRSARSLEPSVCTVPSDLCYRTHVTKVGLLQRDKSHSVVNVPIG